MPTYRHRCNDCKHEWEMIQRMSEDPLTICVSCGTDGEVIRIIFAVPCSGIQLTGPELKEKVFKDAIAARDRARTDESFRANVLGDSYHETQLKKDALTEKLVKIGKEASKIKSTDIKK